MLFVEQEGILRAIDFESSAFSKDAFYVWAFYMPLYIPSDHVYFTYGRRLERDRLWTENDVAHGELQNAIQNEALPFLSKIYTPKDFIENILLCLIPLISQVV